MSTQMNNREKKSHKTEAVTRKYSIKKMFLEILMFTEKHLCQSLVFNKFAGRACNFIKKGLSYSCFPVNFAKFLRTPFLTKHL